MVKWCINILVVLIFLNGCSSSSEDNNPKNLPSKVTLSIASDDGMNPNLWGEASPIEVQVFELKDDSMFMSADYDLIKADYEKALKSNFIENYDYTMTPGQFKFISEFEVDEDTNYIGVMAHFAEPELSEWKKVVKVINKGREYHLFIYFKDYEVKLERVE